MTAIEGVTDETWCKMASLIQLGRDLTPIITHHYKIDDFPESFDAMCSGMSGMIGNK